MTQIVGKICKIFIYMVQDSGFNGLLLGIFGIICPLYSRAVIGTFNLRHRDRQPELESARH